MHFGQVRRDILAARITEEVHRWHSSPENIHRVPLDHACLFWADATVRLLKREYPHLNVQLQAGSASWQCLADDRDDGLMHNVWGYFWTWDKKALNDLAEGQMPEMHVWAAILTPPHELIDLTAPFFRTRAMKSGYEWSAPPPPLYLWADMEGLQSYTCSYKPELQACEVAAGLLQSRRTGEPLNFRMLTDPKGGIPKNQGIRTETVRGRRRK